MLAGAPWGARSRFGTGAFRLHYCKVTTGAPIFLVSACASAEEFVAAFRRYVDRAGIFIPMAEPLPAGKLGRLALTLSDGGVMIEGEAQIVTSSTKPVGLYGRPGMTVKFTEPDDPSKTVIADLEKARLALRPVPPSAPPRKSNAPAEPRPKPPAIVGRIDAANALAETIAIGDVASLRDASGDANQSGGLLKAGQKFVVPSVPTIPSSIPTRTKAPTNPPPESSARPKTPSAPPPVRAKPPTAPPPEGSGRTKSPTSPPSATGIALADALKAAPADPKPEPVKPPPTPVGGTKRRTMIGMPAVDKLPVEKLTATPPPAKPTTLGMAPLKADSAPADKRPRQATPAAPLPVARLPARPAPVFDSASPAVEVSSEATDVTTVPQAALPAVEPVPPVEESQPVEEPPKPTRSGGMRASEIMAAIPTDDWTMSPDASAPVVLPPSEKITPPSEAATKTEKPIVVEAKTPPKGPPTGDWTISADPAQPDGWAPPAKVKKPEPQAKKEPATGNPVHSISSKKELDVQEWEDKPTGIGQPLVEIDSTLMEPLKPMPALEETGQAQALATAPTVTAALAIPPRAATLPPGSTGPQQAITAGPPRGLTTGPQQVITTGPQQVVTTGPSPIAPLPLAPPALTPYPPAPTVNPGFTGPMPQATGAQQAYPAQVDAQQQMQMMGFPRMVSDGGTNFFRDSGSVQHFPPDEPYAAESQRRKRVLLIAVGSAVAAVALVVVIIMATGGKKTSASTRNDGSASAKVTMGSSSITMTPTATTGSGSATPAVGSAGSGSAAVAIEPPKPPPPPPDKQEGQCQVEVKSDPSGAQVAIDKDTLGATPGTFNLPCDAEVKLKIYKKGYFGQIKTVTPTADGAKVDVALAAATFTVKVTSAPAGATITVGGKPMGVTPTSIKLPAFSASTIVLSKDGFTPDTQKVTPKQNGMAHHVTLKKLTGRPKH